MLWTVVCLVVVSTVCQLGQFYGLRQKSILPQYQPQARVVPLALIFWSVAPAFRQF